MLAAEPVVAGTAAVDVAALGAVERAVKVPHYIVVTPVEQKVETKTFITRDTSLKLGPFKTRVRP